MPEASILQIQLSKRLSDIVESEGQRLRLLSAERLSEKPGPHKWSGKEIIGHLIDSAANNHQRFVRAQYEEPIIFYDQDKWVSLQNYYHEDINTLLQLWESYNRHLSHLIANIPDVALSNNVIGRDGKVNTLEFFISDYVDHLLYHLRQIH